MTEGIEFDGVALHWNGACRQMAIAIDPFRPDPGGNPTAALAHRLEGIASAIRSGNLSSKEGIEKALCTCAGYLKGTQLPAVAINVGARTITDEDVPAHQVSEDEDPVDLGF